MGPVQGSGEEGRALREEYMPLLCLAREMSERITWGTAE